VRADEVQLRLVDGTVWLTQVEMATLFETTPQNIAQHIRSVYDDGEPMQDATCKQVLQVRQEGSSQVRRETRLYNLKAILAVGYRCAAPRGAQFRRWATETLNDGSLGGEPLYLHVK
jgi:hypothetical protein